MNLIPAYSETLVLPFSAKEVEIKLKLTVELTPGDVTDQISNQETLLFTGWMHHNKFRIIRRLKRPENFIPVMTGRIEPTRKGCIIFLNYRLNFSSTVFLSLWSFITLSMALLFLLVYNHILYASISISAGFFNYIFTTFSFHRQVRKSQEVFYSIFEHNSFPD